MTNDNWKSNGPVVVGGLGGSGTRVVAEILATLRFFVGSDLNSASDNLWHTFLFKRADWYRQHQSDKELISTGLSLMEKLLLRSSRPSSREFRFLLEAFKSMASDGFSRSHRGRGRTKWAMQRLLKMAMASSRKGHPYVGWGWKEPNAHLLVDNLAEHFRGFKYIHTVRHGLDMAFSQKVDQLHMWGGLYDVEVPRDEKLIPLASYRYWVRANRLAVQRGQKLGEGRFLLVNYDRLCADPHHGVGEIARFIGVTPSADDMKRASDLIRPQESTGRHQQHGVEMFQGEDLDALREFGFSA